MMSVDILGVVFLNKVMSVTMLIILILVDDRLSVVTLTDSILSDVKLIPFL
jgi:hypothetical protein